MYAKIYFIKLLHVKIKKKIFFVFIGHADGMCVIKGSEKIYIKAE